VILAASVFEISFRETGKQTDADGWTDPTVGVGNYQ